MANEVSDLWSTKGTLVSKSTLISRLGLNCEYSSSSARFFYRYHDSSFDVRVFSENSIIHYLFTTSEVLIRLQLMHLQKSVFPWELDDGCFGLSTIFLNSQLVSESPWIDVMSPCILQSPKRSPKINIVNLSLPRWNTPKMVTSIWWDRIGFRHCILTSRAVQITNIPVKWFLFLIILSLQHHEVYQLRTWGRQF